MRKSGGGQEACNGVVESNDREDNGLIDSISHTAWIRPLLQKLLED
jgi:hypothetical protein